MNRFSGALFVALLVTPACSPIVGGACVQGAIVCEGRCVDPTSDELACGGCGQACPAMAMCVESRCVEVRDGEVPDAWPTDADPRDAGVDADVGPVDAPELDAPERDAPELDAPSDLDAPPDLDAPLDLDAPELDAPSDRDAPSDPDAPDAGTADAFVPFDAGMPSDAGASDAGVRGDAPFDMPDAGPLVCDLGTVVCDGRCVDLATDVTSCGVCGRACGAGQLCSSGACVDRCTAPTVACGTACVQLDSDPDNCGACGRVCATGLCSMGMCTGALAGHLVVIGHDYEVNRAAMDRVLGNAVFLSSSASVRLLGYEGTASAGSIAGVRRAVSSVASTMGRAVTWTAATDPSAVSAQLRTTDVFLIHAQAGSTDAEIASLGVAWSLALSTFLDRGGVVVVLDVMAPHPGTWGVLAAAGFLSVDHLEDATSSTVSVIAPWDGVVIGVPLTYRAERTSVRFIGADLPVVARDASGPIVLHRTVVPAVEPL